MHKTATQSSMQHDTANEISKYSLRDKTTLVTGSQMRTIEVIGVIIGAKQKRRGKETAPCREGNPVQLQAEGLTKQQDC